MTKQQVCHKGKAHKRYHEEHDKMEEVGASMAERAGKQSHSCLKVHQLEHSEHKEQHVHARNNGVPLHDEAEVGGGGEEHQKGGVIVVVVLKKSSGCDARLRARCSRATVIAIIPVRLKPLRYIQRSHAQHEVHPHYNEGDHHAVAGEIKQVAHIFEVSGASTVHFSCIDHISQLVHCVNEEEKHKHALQPKSNVVSSSVVRLRAHTLNDEPELIPPTRLTHKKCFKYSEKAVGRIECDELN
mmetsp:Transcript_20876/g.53895  ORF Transcript_20876/g.53895 Transcript_20876/m.53895 type:complete len:242 (-) Transcript_20876:1114-1839(-)